MVNIFLIQSLFVGFVLGILYGIALVYEKKRALSQYIEAKKHGKELPRNRVPLFTMFSLIRYGMLIGALMVLMYTKVVNPYVTAFAFLVGFWSCIGWLMRKRHEN